MFWFDYRFAGGEMPEEFDEDGSYQDDYSEHHSLSEQSSSPAWKEQRLAEGQDSLSVICGELLHGKQVKENVSFVRQAADLISRTAYCKFL